MHYAFITCNIYIRYNHLKEFVLLSLLPILQEPICAAHVHLIWTQVMGDIVQEELESAYAAASLFEHVHSALNYSEMESMLLCGLIDRGVLAVLNDW